MTERPKTQAEWVQLLEQRIAQSELSDTRFAREVLKRDPRTLRRWASGEQPIPSEVQDFLVDPQKAPWP